jgi:hypothetical protein
MVDVALAPPRRLPRRSPGPLLQAAPRDGRGRQFVVARQSGAAGPWFEVTWPSFGGVMTALAPGRFSGALNQAPSAGLGRIGDWLIERWRVWRRGRVPPGVLLRRAFDECAGFDDAVRLLTETPLCRPAIFALAGSDPADGVVIERQERAAFVHWAPVCVTNHQLSATLGGRPRWRTGGAHDRLDLMRGRMAAVTGGLAWLVAPVRDEASRLAVTANAATGELTVQGFAHGAPSTSVLRLVA